MDVLCAGCQVRPEARRVGVELPHIYVTRLKNGAQLNAFATASLCPGTKAEAPNASKAYARVTHKRALCWKAVAGKASNKS